MWELHEMTDALNVLQIEYFRRYTCTVMTLDRN